jgi:hypothetical protein
MIRCKSMGQKEASKQWIYFWSGLNGKIVNSCQCWYEFRWERSMGWLNNSVPLSLQAGELECKFCWLGRGRLILWMNMWVLISSNSFQFNPAASEKTEARQLSDEASSVPVVQMLSVPLFLTLNLNGQSSAHSHAVICCSVLLFMCLV